MGRVRAVVIGVALAATTIVVSTGSAAAAPAPESALRAMRPISVGDGVACGTQAQNRTYCWGEEDQGSMGNGASLAPFGVPVKVLGNSEGVGAGRDFACLRYSSGGYLVKCWGHDDRGQLGAAGSGSQDTPVTVQAPTGTGSLRDVNGLSLGDSTACARQFVGDGRVLCWGNGDNGLIGDGGGVDRDRPSYVSDGSGRLTGVVQVSVGLNHACALRNTGEVWCWGNNSFGELGTDLAQASSPVAVPVQGEDPSFGPLRHVVQVDAGSGSTCAVLTSGRVLCWGDNSLGQLGDGTFVSSPVPTPVQNSFGDDDQAGVAQVSTGRGTTCAVLTSGGARCWGSGALGNGDTSGDPSPWPVIVRNPTNTGPLRAVAAISANGTACATLTNGQVRCWGQGAGGTMGNGSASNRYLPVVVLRTTTPPINP